MNIRVPWCCTHGNNVKTGEQAIIPKLRIFFRLHSYTKCNMVNIQVRVKNRITIGQWEVFTSPYNHTAIIRVSCPFQNLQVESSPAATITKEIQLLPMATLSLKVELETGKCVM